jgi:hypothetical protein
VSLSNRLKIAVKAIRELGVNQVGLYAYYQLGLRSGYFRRLTPARKPLQIKSPEIYEIPTNLLKIPSPDDLTAILGENSAALFAEASEIEKNKVRLFGGPPRDLDFVVPLPLEHWSKVSLDSNSSEEEDIKFTWEAARFAWVYTLVRAYVLSGDDAYADTFWQDFEAFSDMNLTNMGPNWMSAQEVAIRLISLFFTHQVLSASPASSPERIALLQVAIADHANRIPPTLAYARAQNNNHLLLEAAGLITAGICMPKHPKAETWRGLGSRWFNQALQGQIEEDGTYIQQSVNYHRLMLQAALWINFIGEPLPPESIEKLAAATKWLNSLVDEASGRASNLGHNDGSYLQPLSSCPYHDQRPILQAAGQAFLGERLYPPGHWDEYSLWLGLKAKNENQAEEKLTEEERPLEVLLFPQSHVVMRNTGNQSWACLRAAKFKDRPAHADQLHFDLWWQGQNLAQDAGSYLYNGEAPWDNSLAQTSVHNTITINGQDQMRRADRFLWLDWAQAEITDLLDAQGKTSIRLTAQHNGYNKQGVIHQRTVTTSTDGNWIIEDALQPTSSPGKDSRQTTAFDENPRAESGTCQACLHWLLPDWSWEIEQSEDKMLVTLRLRAPKDWLTLQIAIQPATQVGKGDTAVQARIYRAGEAVYGSEQGEAIKGWTSPTYGYKIPALSFEVETESRLPIRFKSTWDLP